MIIEYSKEEAEILAKLMDVLVRLEGIKYAKVAILFFERIVEALKKEDLDLKNKEELNV